MLMQTIQLQTKNHTKINYEYCKTNPKNILDTATLSGDLQQVIFKMVILPVHQPMM